MKTYYFLFILFITSNTCLAQVGFQELIVENSGNLLNPYEAMAADLDGDGDNDILVASIGDSKVSWYQNLDGLGTFGPQKVISTNVSGIQAVRAADMDGDGDLDVIALSHNSKKVVWFANTNGLGTFGAEQLISPTVLGSSPQTSLSIADIDGDGDMDVLVPFYGASDKISWFENLSGNGTVWKENLVTTAVDSPTLVLLADLDGDHDKDIISVSISDGKLAWYENIDGLGNFGPQKIIRQEFSLMGAIAADVDGDGDLDIISTAGITFNEMAWYENTDGKGTFGSKKVITTEVSYAGSIDTVDLDDDGDLDIVVASKNNNKVIWFQNTDGLGAFAAQQLISGNLLKPNSVFPADFNGDHKVDLVSTTLETNKVYWFRNQGVVTNEIYGKVLIDRDANGCDSNDIVASGLLLNTTDGVNSYSTFTLGNGSYNLFPGEGSYQTKIIGGLPDYYISTPVSQTSAFVGVGKKDQVNYCLKPVGEINDLEVSIYPALDNPRPGFNTSYQIIYKNKGTMQLDGNIEMAYDSGKLQFLSADQTVSSSSAGKLTFNYAGLKPFETKVINLKFKVYAPPVTNINDVLTASVTVSPVSNDATADDNTFVLRQTVIGSYDPNDISVLEGDKLLLADIDEYLHYIIRFQNTGTASAINVRVDNRLDDKLDWNSLQIENASHAMQAKIKNGKNISFIFSEIHLPDSTHNEPDSHGYIMYKIKPKTNVVVGNVFSNKADIVFDFNPAIITNTVTTEIVNPVMAVYSQPKTRLFAVFPNPVADKATIQGKEVIRKVILLNSAGQILKTTAGNKNDMEIDLSDFPGGVYFLEVHAVGTKETIKIIRK